MSASLTGSSLGRPGGTDMKANLMKSRMKLSAKAMDRLMKRAEVISKKPAAKSAAHEGVVERPMDKQLSKMLELKRAQVRGRGTSVKRLKRGAREEEEELLEEGEEAHAADVESGTSIARSQSVYTMMPLVRVSTDKLRSVKPRDNEDDAQDLPI